ncbi:Mup3 protein [Saccharomycopsis crataegensis]|uniref:Mup3 protein n=1 Tax=Saccharomycopsis crataegensis TaxID=43959 RepID=A0AAV5QJ65_9ASCO|nr:Mup3 protein [Saccharomycopsis crataegensis]
MVQAFYSSINRENSHNQPEEHNNNNPGMSSIPYSRLSEQLEIRDNEDIEDGDDDDNAVQVFDPLADNDEDDDDLVPLTDPLESEGVSLKSRKSTEFDLNNVDTLLEDLPQGRNYGIYACVVFIISRIIGSGIFSTPGGIYRDVGGSPFLFFLAWVVATLISFLCMIVYLEIGTLMPRSGGPKVFLEMIYRKPKHLATVLICLHSIVFGFTCSGAVTFGQYFLRAIGIEVDISQSNASRYVGLILIAICLVIQSLSVKTSLYVQNVLGFIKLILLGILTVTGLYVLLLPQSITHVENQLHWNEFFAPKREVTISSFTSAVLQAIFSFSGWESIYFITSEIKNPIRTLKIVGPLSLVISLLTYTFVNIAYLKTINGEEIFASGQLLGSILFEKVFGPKIGKTFLSITVALSAAGNVYVVLYAISRMSQEVFREGILPCSRFMASNWPGLGTPVPTLSLSFLISAIFLLIPPPGDIFSYIVSLETYMLEMIMLAIIIGLFKLRRDYPDIKRPIKVPLVAPTVGVIVVSYLLITPLLKKNENTAIGSLPNYGVLGIILLLLGVLYWLMLFMVLPKIGNYKLRKEQEVLSDGLVIKHWKKFYN